MNPGAVTLNESNINSGIVMRQRKLLHNSVLWHKIIVQNSYQLNRDFVLKSILDAVFPHDFIPVCYTVVGNAATFFVRNCSMAIEKLCHNNLIVFNPQSIEKPFKLSIVLAYSHTNNVVVDVQENLSKVIAKRYQNPTKTLNLDNFCKDPDLIEYCTFSQSRIFYFVLHLSKQYSFQTLRLGNNDIRMLSPLESIWSVKTLTTLDLRNNMIEKVTELNILKHMQLTELLLDGNPLCDYYDAYSYIQAIKEICPTLEKLDGIALSQKGFLGFRRNYLCSADGHELVDQFLEHFFILYDSDKRSELEAMYVDNSLFSITCQYLPGQTTTLTANLGNYKRISRNLQLLSDLSKSNEFLVEGGSNIIKTLCSLPPTEHDFYSFTVDLVYYTSQSAIITVTGVFRETTKTLLDLERILGFSRTFVLVTNGNEEYNIVNDHLHVSNATTAQQLTSFKVRRRMNLPELLTLLPALTEREKDCVVETFKKITNLNLNWSKKCLEECHYDLKEALSTFVDLYKFDKLPETAFSTVL